MTEKTSPEKMAEVLCLRLKDRNCGVSLRHNYSTGSRERDDYSTGDRAAAK